MHWSGLHSRGRPFWAVPRGTLADLFPKGGCLALDGRTGSPASGRAFCRGKLEGGGTPRVCVEPEAVSAQVLFWHGVVEREKVCAHLSCHGKIPGVTLAVSCAPLRAAEAQKVVRRGHPSPGLPPFLDTHAKSWGRTAWGLLLGRTMLGI